MTEPITVEKMTAWMPVTLEWLIDSGSATPEQIAEYEAPEAARPKPSRRVRFAVWRWYARDRLRQRVHHALFGTSECQE